MSRLIHACADHVAGQLNLPPPICHPTLSEDHEQDIMVLLYPERNFRSTSTRTVASVSHLMDVGSLQHATIPLTRATLFQGSCMPRNVKASVSPLHLYISFAPGLVSLCHPYYCLNSSIATSKHMKHCRPLQRAMSYRCDLLPLFDCSDYPE